APLAFDGRGRHADYFRDLFDSQPAEVAQFDDLDLPRIESLQIGERLVQGDQIYLLFRREAIDIVEWDPLGLAASLGCPARLGVIDQHLSHQPRGRAEEVRAILPIDFALVYQPQKNLMDQSRRLQRVVDPLTAKIALRHPAQLVIDDRN